MTLACFARTIYQRIGNIAKGMSLRYGVVVLSDLHHSLVLFVGDSGGGVGENH